MNHGFVRAKDGTITEFDPPGSIGTFMADGGCINPAGFIVGSYFDATFLEHCFVRDPDGTITAFDVPGAGIGPLSTAPRLGASTRAGTIEEVYVDPAM